MKRLFYIGWLCLTLAACSREELPDLSGKPASLTLFINTLESDVKTRVDTPEDERRIFNLYIFVFNADGSIDYQQQLHPFSSILDNKTLTIDGLTCSNGKSVAAIANIDDKNTIVNIKESTLDGITSLSELESLIVSMEEGRIERGTNFLMSGFAENVMVSANGPTSATVSMKRVDAKIRFNITTKEGVTFTPSDWRIVSLPLKIRVMDTPLNLCSEITDYFNTDWAKFESTGTTFAFYSMEHILTPEKEIPIVGEYEEHYALREKQTKTPNESGGVTNGDFEYAPAAGTYVEMRGNVAYSTNMGGKISADVLYTVHLGGVDKNVNDYNTLRNTDYTYNVKIVSVEKIEIEVMSNVGSEDEQRPGAEGDITEAKEILNLDAHNEIFDLKFNQSDVDETLTWNVSTPFSEGSEVNNQHDYKWIYFRINKKSGLRYDDDFRLYLGDQNIYAENVALDDYMSDISENKDKMLDVEQLVALLKKSKQRHSGGINSNLFDSEGNAKFTAFVNEYYYETNPNSKSTAVDGLWKEFTNQQQRVMNILSNLKYSPDGKSSKTEAVYSIRQHAIQTMYNRSHNEENYTAWGTEMIQDNTPIAFENTNPSSSVTSDKSNGRKNTIQMWLSKKWSEYIAEDKWSMKSNYDAAKYKCLRMNRDNNGNGTIDNSEVQWYLASINQLTDIWIGEWSYDPAARLYKKTNGEEQYFVSSTVPERSGSLPNRRDNPQILWSSEGSSIGPLSEADGGKGVKTLVYYRCVRNLGIPRNADIDTQPSELVEYDKNTRRMSLKRLDAQSIRGYYQETVELPKHHEREADNKPYWAFDVRKTPVGSNYTWQSLFEEIQSGAGPCPDGYRVPNQRELALMLSRIGNDGNWTLDNHFSRTSFQFDSDRPGFAVSKNSDVLFLLHANKETGGVRCVKDYNK